jgi:hypothetical protein
MAFADHNAAKFAGWFSRRHQSAEAHLAVKEANRLRSDEKYASAYARQAETAKLSPGQKLARLDQKFGKGLGATQERARLAGRIENARVEREKAQRKVEADKARIEAKRAKRDEKSQRDDKSQGSK